MQSTRNSSLNGAATCVHQWAWAPPPWTKTRPRSPGLPHARAWIAQPSTATSTSSWGTASARRNHSGAWVCGRCSSIPRSEHIGRTRTENRPCRCMMRAARRLGGRDLMGMVANTTPESDDPIPNCGGVAGAVPWHDPEVPRRRLALDRVHRTQGVGDAAVMDLLGYELAPAVRLMRPTPMYRRTHFLPPESRHRAAPVSYTHLRAHETVLDLVC